MQNSASFKKVHKVIRRQYVRAVIAEYQKTVQKLKVKINLNLKHSR